MSKFEKLLEREMHLRKETHAENRVLKRRVGELQSQVNRLRIEKKLSRNKWKPKQKL